MKILHIIISLHIGGAEKMLKRLIESNFNNTVQKHIVVSLTDIGEVGAELQGRGIEVYSLRLRSTLSIPVALWRLVRLIRASKVDIIQTWMYHADLLGGVAALLAGNRNVIWGIRTTDIAEGAPFVTIAIRWLNARLSYWLPRVIVCAAEASKQSHIALGFDSTKMVVVPNGYDFLKVVSSSNERQSFRNLYEIKSDEIVIGSLGRFHEIKGQAYFVQVATLLAPKYPQLKFLMVGRGLNWENPLLVNWINKSGYKNRFILLGERNDIPQCLSAMDIFCLHSLSEGFPNVLAEAMASGLPCVTTDVGDSALLLMDAGIVVPKADPVALANGVEHMVNIGPKMRLNYGAKAKALVEKNYSMDHACKRFEKIYLDLTMKESI